MGVRAGLLRGFLAGSNRLGGPRLLDRLRGTQAQLLMYHGVPVREHFDGVENFYGYNVPLAEFQEQMEYLARRCNVLSVSDLLAGRGLERGRLNVALTFDDGYGNNVTNALPVLERLDLPATFAIATDFVLGGRPLWNDVVEHAVQTCALPSVSVPWNGEERAFPLGTRGERLQLYSWLLARCVEVEQERRDDLIAGACEALGVDASPEAVFREEDYRPMSAEDVRRLAAGGRVEIASHSVHHVLLAKLQPENLRQELSESKRALEELTGRPCPLLCLPGGSKDRRVLDEAFAAGYEYVLTSDVGRADLSARVIRRNGIFRRDSIHRFADELHGPVLRLLRRARNR